MSSFRPKTLIVSPGVPLSLPWIQNFIKDGGILSSELELGFSFLTSEKVIAITGSVGKSTTVSLLGIGAKSFSPNSFVGGNLGTPLAVYARSLLRGVPKSDWVILELSSYQLENFRNLTADWSGIVSLTTNHMERYESLDSYYKTKFTLVDRTKRLVICNRQGNDLLAWVKKQSPNSKIKWIDPEDSSLKSFDLKSSLLLGNHNQQNLALASKIAVEAGWPAGAINAMKGFSGMPHRLENMGTANGVTFVNDSKATTIESVKVAVESVVSECTGNIHLLIGGRDKNLPWHDLGTLRNIKNLRFYFFGECRELAKSKSDLPGESFSTLKAATVAAVENATAGDLILLSPGGTSLDEFKNFEERGDFFRKIVNVS